MAKRRTTFSLPDALLEQVDAAARELRLSRDRVIIQAVEAFVGRFQSQQLLDQINQAEGRATDGSEAQWMRATRSVHRRVVRGEW